MSEIETGSRAQAEQGALYFSEKMATWTDEVYKALANFVDSLVCQFKPAIKALCQLKLITKPHRHRPPRSWRKHVRRMKQAKRKL